MFVLGGHKGADSYAFGPLEHWWCLIQLNLHLPGAAYCYVAFLLKKPAGGVVSTINPGIQSHACIICGFNHALSCPRFHLSEKIGFNSIVRVVRMYLWIKVEACIPDTAYATIANNLASRCDDHPGVGCEIGGWILPT